MAIATNEIQILWSTANSLSVSSGSTGTSDAFSFTSNTPFQATVQLKADNNGTPAAGDTVDFYLLSTLGDPDGASTDEYATTTQGHFLLRLNTNTSDPAISPAIQIPMPQKGGKIYAVNNAASNAITVSTIILEQTG